jgi:hypothetical protein
VEGERQELFALDVDPEEQRNIAQDGGATLAEELATELALFLESARARRPEHWKRVGVDLSSRAAQERLRGLGYLA